MHVCVCVYVSECVCLSVSLSLFPLIDLEEFIQSPTALDASFFFWWGRVQA